MKISSRLRAQTPSNPKDTFRLPKVLEILFLIVIFLELLSPFVTTVLGLDGRLQLKMVVEFSNLISSGILIPTWAPDGFYNFGAAAFYFYPPLTFYFTSIIHLLTSIDNPFTLFQILSLLMTIASFFTARPLLRTIGSTGYRLNLSAALFAFAPLRIAELYSRSSLSTHVTYVFLPLMWDALIAVMLQTGTSRSRRIFQLALWFALIALTNVPITVMSGISIIVVALTLWRKLTWKALWEALLAAAISSALALYHYASVVAALPFARLEDLHFLHHPADIKLYFHLGPGTYYLLLLYGAVGIIACAFAWTWWKKTPASRLERTICRIGLVLTGFTLYLDFFPLSAGLWNIFPPLRLVQFPWRFYPLILLFGCIVVGTARTPLMKLAATWVSAVWIIGAVLPTILVVFSLHLFPSTERPLEDATEFLPVNFKPPATSNGGGMRGAVENILQPHASDPAASGDFRSGEKVDRVSIEPYHETFVVSLQESRPITFHRFFWPFWHLDVNGAEINSRPDSIGRAIAILPAGHYTANWQLERTPLECAGLWISGIAWAGMLLFWGIGIVRMRVKKKQTISS